ncbi:DUF2269 family protein [Cupriavidus plantarum]|uniref:DUF2269 family protein n=1 Tax=Cupriavidus plantarum TaxID=942865 RepID=UPI001B15EBC5|nr:DUF2269 domain-containing protein [Cupriavidus plantarum]CAG2136771.1 hypothetical protein LMG26296_02416 [Cupriavidus plantarum]SMR84795.1 Uncharacterized membrane protein [Cupriavidus plantarum]
MDYVTLKWIHVVSSTLLFGTGIGSAFYLVGAVATRNVRTVAATARMVVVADTLFTATTAILQPVTGYMLMRSAGFDWSMAWLRWSIWLYVLAIACWLPVVWIQIRLRDVLASVSTDAFPRSFWPLFWSWFVLGFPALFAFLAIFYLMIAKPLQLP